MFAVGSKVRYLPTGLEWTVFDSVPQNPRRPDGTRIIHINRVDDNGTMQRTNFIVDEDNGMHLWSGDYDPVPGPERK